MAGGKKSGVGESYHRLTARLPESDYEKLSYWSEKAGCSMSELISVMLYQYIDIQNGNYQLPTLEAQRLNQLIDGMAVMSRNMQSLEQVVTSGFDSLIGLTRGDNYLYEESDS